MILGLGLVLALMFGALLLIKRLSLPRGPAAASLKVVGAAAVGPRERVVLVEVGDKVLVLGVAPGQVESLHTFDASSFPKPSSVEIPSATGEGFAERFRQVLERRK
ncbi:MAG: flagellar biosynthetic protein FliO [Rhodocyclaceae bacterium]|nr:flagellar biosynthetic protein FliO [Rhodocyclaceae bacterium]